MTALGPIGALAICDVQTVRVFAFDTAAGSLGMSGTASGLRVIPTTVQAALAMAGALRENGITTGKQFAGAARFSGRILRSLLRAPLRFAQRKGIITRGAP